MPRARVLPVMPSTQVIEPGDADERGELGALGSDDVKLNAAGFRTAFLAVLGMVTILPFQAFVAKVFPKWYQAIPIYFHRSICFAFGVERTVLGERASEPGILFVANHVSWLDIPVLGADVPGSFVAKAEIRGWGIFGTMARLQRTIFVKRERRTSSADQRNAIVERLAAGHNVILFPEGTSSAGNGVLPFKSALFSVAEAARDAGLTPVIQPISLAYTDINAIPVVRAVRHKLSWVGDMEFLPHVVQVMCLSQIKSTVHFHAPVHLEEFSSRKALALHCEHVVNQGVRLANSGRLLVPRAVAKREELP